MKSLRILVSTVALSAMGFAGCEYASYPESKIAETATEKTLSQGTKSESYENLENKIDELTNKLNNPAPDADDKEIQALKDQINQLQKAIEDLKTNPPSPSPPPAPADTTGPTVKEKLPTGTDVAASTKNIVVTFSEKLAPGSINKDSLAISPSVIVDQVTDTNPTFTFALQGTLSTGKTYTTTLKKDGIKDEAGNPMSGDQNWSFTTKSSSTSDVTARVVPTIVTNVTAPMASRSSLAPVTRFYNPATGDHFFTLNPEKESVQDYLLESAATFHAYPLGTNLPNLMPIYRWLSADHRMHFYTTSKSEPKTGFQGEGVAFLAYSPVSIPSVNAAPVFRLYNPGNGDHHYTIDPVEKENAGANGYIFEGIGWYAPSQNAVPNNAVPVYRYYNSGNGDHFYTTSLPEGLKATGTIPETSGFKAYLSPKTGASVAVHRFYNSDNGDHFYTTNKGEGDGAGGYKYEGIAFYAEPAQSDGTIPLYRLYNPGNGDHFYTASSQEQQTAVAGGYVAEGIACYVTSN